jgi:DNA-binding SARP family transcriptional activator
MIIESAATMEAGPQVAVQSSAAAIGPQITLLNSFELRLNGERVALQLSAQRLLAFLALHDHPLLRIYVAGSLWIDSTNEHASGCLRSLLWRVGHVSQLLVDIVGPQLRLAPGVRVDVHEATANARELLRSDSSDVTRLQLTDLYLDGDLLPDWYDDWIVIERERFRQLRVHALERLCERLIEARCYGRAAEAALAAVRAEPLRESAHRAVIRVHLAEGNAADALRHYLLYRRLLFEQLGQAPSALMEALVRPLNAG